MEMDRAQKAAPSSNKTVADVKAKSKAAGRLSLLAIARPILMAVGAVLLAAMAMPLVKTLTRSEAPPVVEDVRAPGERRNRACGPTVDTSVQAASPMNAAPDAPATEIAASDPPAESQKILRLTTTPPASTPTVGDAAAPVNALMAPAPTHPLRALRHPPPTRRTSAAGSHGSAAGSAWKCGRGRRDQAGSGTDSRDRGACRNHAAVTFDCRQGW